MRNAEMVATLKRKFNVARHDRNTSVAPLNDGSFRLTTWSVNWLSGAIEDRRIEEVDEAGLIKRLISDGITDGWKLQFVGE